MSETEAETPELSPNEAFDCLVSGDQSVEIQGYIDEIQAPTIVGSSKKLKLMKFFVSNGEKRAVILLWSQYIPQYQPLIKINEIVQLEGLYCKALDKKYHDSYPSNVVKFELVIQKNSVITLKGPINLECSQTSSPIETTFEEIGKFSGKTIKIIGYIKTKFAESSNSKNTMSYGCGAICNANMKITVNIRSYVPLEFEKGTPVSVVGKVSDDGPISISCQSSSAITVVPNLTSMDTSKLLRIVRSPKRALPGDFIED